MLHSARILSLSSTVTGNCYNRSGDSESRDFLRRSRDKPGGVRFKDDEVNEYLNRAIDARDIERMKSEHIQNCLLTFKDKDVEQQVQCDVRRCT